jgi:hypothetical protein
MDHCPSCKWFAGRMTWGCLYRRKKQPLQTRAEQAIDKFRRKMHEIDTKIALSQKRDKAK